jgi:succinate dehydrogenase/fumarate reductase flavoprotein subunit
MSMPKKRYDIVVAGYGFAGAAAAIAAADEGATVALLEKMPQPGGISITAGGGLRVAHNAQAAFDYIKASNHGRTPDENIWPIAQGMVWLPEWFDTIGAHCEAVTSIAERYGNYPLPGFKELCMLEVESIPGFDPRGEYPHAKALTGGSREDKGGQARNSTGGGAGVFKVVESAIQARADRITVFLNAPVERLIQSDRSVVGVKACIDGQSVDIDASHGVVLACGGFEGAPDIQQQYWQISPVLSSACRGNTGDGIRMAQAVGADLWHMWHFHGTYGFRHPVHDDVGIRMKRLPDWRPAGNGHPSDADERAAAMAWVLVDQDGRRFMNEYSPYVQDTGHRDMEPYDPGTLRFPRVPCWCVFDDNARKLYPIGSPVLNDSDPSVHYEWSADNLKEVENGLLHRADSIKDLALFMGVEPSVLVDTVTRWNEHVDAEADPYGRPRTSMVPVSTGPFYCGQMWPVISNTQGGPRHDAVQRVVNPFGEPIAGLYTAGELGSIWGSLYTGGCNLAECFITGVIAARDALSAKANV